jgi:predicted neutral ceramidase superfamily lipid hydrolase
LTVRPDGFRCIIGTARHTKGSLDVSAALSTDRWPARMLLVALMVPSLAACWLAAKSTYDVATDRFLSFSNPYTSAALLAVVVVALATVAWLAIVTWNSQPPRRRLIVAYALACTVLWTAAVVLALSVVDNSY